jgi:hypothetical protein
MNERAARTIKSVACLFRFAPPRRTNEEAWDFDSQASSVY